MSKMSNYISSKLKMLQSPFYLSVCGDSMVPTINSGERVLIEPYANETLKPGDIIVYRKFEDHLTAHRILNIVRLSETRFYCETKGDNNIKADSYKVFNHEIVGIVNLKDLLTKVK